MAKGVVKPEKHTTDSTRTPEATPTRSARVALERFFTRPGVDPLAELDWDRRSAVISGEDGRVVFEQHDVEVPRAWSQTATNVVVSKYFRGPLGSPKREVSVRQLVGRVVETISGATSPTTPNATPSPPN